MGDILRSRLAREPHCTDRYRWDCGLEQARATLRGKVAFYDKDRFFAPDIIAATDLLASRCLNELAPAKLLPSL